MTLKNSIKISWKSKGFLWKKSFNFLRKVFFFWFYLGDYSLRRPFAFYEKHSIFPMETRFMTVLGFCNKTFWYFIKSRLVLFNQSKDLFVLFALLRKVSWFYKKYWMVLYQNNCWSVLGSLADIFSKGQWFSNK